VALFLVRSSKPAAREGRHNVLVEVLKRSSTTSQSPLRPTRGAGGLNPLDAMPSPDCTDPQAQEGWAFLGLLHEAGAVTVERRYERGEVLFGEGEPGNALYLLTEGAVKLSRGYSDDGKEATLMLLAPWEVFGELSFGRRAYQHARAEALTACRVKKVPKVFVERAMRAHPEVALKVVDLLWLELARHREMAGCLLPRKVEDRLANLLSILAQRFGGEEEAGFVIGLRLTQEELAKMISCTRESVAQALAGLRRRGLLAVVRGRIVILDSAGLMTNGRRPQSTHC
jgi:CRP/FNR family transcriptional regulator, global nitrogen regulator